MKWKGLDWKLENTQILRNFLWGTLLLPRSKISRNRKVRAKKCMKKDLMKHGKCVLHKVFFSNF